MFSQQALEQEVSNLLERLKSVLCTASTESVFGWCFSDQLFRRLGDEGRLASPAKQIPFLFGVLLSTKPPVESHDLRKEEWQEVKHLLDELFRSYTQLYYPSKEQIGSLSNEWLQSREVAMLAFLHYFNTGLLASVEQITDRIVRYVAPFDRDLQALIGLSATEALSMCKWISAKLQSNLDKLQDAVRDAGAASEAISLKAKKEKWSPDKLKEQIQTPENVEIAKRLMGGLNSLGKNSIEELEKAFPNTAKPFLNTFSVKRGKAPELRYPTEQSAYEVRPIIRLSDDEIVCLSSNALHEAVLKSCEQALFRAPGREKFLRARDQTLEGEAREYLTSLLDAGAHVFSEVFESVDAQHEHDVVADDAYLQIVLEAKAAPPREPFRDPDKAFTRVRDAFRGDTGIQKAFEQGNRIVRKLKKGETVTLYDRKGTAIGQLEPSAKKLPVCICVTRDNFGGLATKLSLLLEKERGDAFPWAVNILDLANLSMAWNYLKWGSKEFRDYLEQRALLHEKGFADDELDFAGFFIRHGSFREAIESKADLYHFNPEYSSFFDDLYHHVYQGGPPVTVKQTKPVMMDLRKSLQHDRPIFINSDEKEIKEPGRLQLRRASLRARKQERKAKKKMRKASKAKNRRKRY